MSFQINTVTVSGNLTRDPEARQTPGGAQVTSFSIAHNERYKNPSGEWEDRPNFFDVTIFGGQGDWLVRNASKGDPVTVSGNLRWRQWENQQGEKRSAVEIVARDLAMGQRGGGKPAAIDPAVGPVPVVVPQSAHAATGDMWGGTPTPTVASPYTQADDDDSIPF